MADVPIEPLKLSQDEPFKPHPYSAPNMPSVILNPDKLSAEDKKLLADGVTTMVTSKTGGMKGRKIERYDLIPAGPLKMLATVFGKGAEKYADRNWEKGVEWSLNFGAMQRHLWAYWGGQTIDPESGLPHLAHAAWHCFTLMEFLNTHPELDDRSKNAQPTKLDSGGGVCPRSSGDVDCSADLGSFDGRG